MPKTKFQNVVFTLMMSFLMVYAMICYNISMNIGGMTNQVFLMAFHEMIIMWPAAFILEFFLVDHLAHKLAFCMVTPQDRPIVITLKVDPNSSWSRFCSITCNSFRIKSACSSVVQTMRPAQSPSSSI